MSNFEWYDWTNGYEIKRDARDSALKEGEDIRNAFYSLQDGYHYFRLEMYRNPSLQSQGHADLYGFFLGTGKESGFSQFSKLLGIHVDSYFDVSAKRKLSGDMQMTPESGTIVDGKEYAFDIRYSQNGKYFDWAIPEDELPKNFAWLAAALTRDLDGTLKLVDRAVDAGIPIPGTAWLFGSGIAGLIAMKKRKSAGPKA